MDSKEPVLLVVLVETASLRWFVAGINLAGTEFPLLRSVPGDLSPYQEVEGEEQVAFLRHRLSGVLQRGCDRLWARQLKPCHLVFVTDGPFLNAPAELTPRLAEHLEQWLWNPPVVFYTLEPGSDRQEPSSLKKLAGELPASLKSPLEAGLPKLWQATLQSNRWEQAPAKAKA